MKSSFTFKILMAIILVLLILPSCHRQENGMLLPELTHAEAIMYQHPDSALAILEQMSMPATSNRLLHATWCLLMTQARYKNYIDESSDSLINIAYEYFMEKDDPQRKALALYLKGALNEEWKDVEKATLFYLQASDEVEKTTDYQLGHLIHLYLGNIYLYRSLTAYAEKALLKSLEYAKLSENSVYMSQSLASLARVYYLLRNWEKSICYYKEAIETVDETANTQVLSIALGELSDVYAAMGNYPLALKYIRESISLREMSGAESEQTFLIIGDLYRLMHENDSAYYYLNKTLLTDNIYTKRSAYQALFFLSKREQKYDKALEYGEKMYAYQDSIEKVSRSRALIEMQEKYNQEKALNERNLLKIEKDSVVRNSLLGLSFLLLIIGVLVYVFQRKLIHKQRTIKKHEEQITANALKMHQNESLIARNESRINGLLEEMSHNKDMQEQLDEQQHLIVEIRSQNEALSQENVELQKNIVHYSASLIEKAQELELLDSLTKENQLLRDREKFLCSQLLKHTKVLNELKSNPRFLDPAPREEVVVAVNKLYNNFTERLLKQMPALTEEDVWICCLIKLHLSVPGIADVLAISSTSVSRQKLRLKERIIQQIGRPLEENQTLDMWVWEY